MTNCMIPRVKVLIKNWSARSLNKSFYSNKSNTVTFKVTFESPTFSSNVNNVENEKRRKALENSKEKLISSSINLSNAAALLDQSKESLENKNEFIENYGLSELKKFSCRYPDFLPLHYESPPYNVGDEIEITVLELNEAGQGLSMKDHWIFMTPFVLPGEVVKIQISRNYQGLGYSNSKLVKVLKPSVDRIDPACKYFGKCNSCQYQHMPYQKQLNQKNKIIHSIFNNFIGSSFSKDIANIIRPIIPAPSSYFYRTKMSPHFKKFSRDANPKTHPIGYNDIDNHIMDIDSCPLVTSSLQRRYSHLREEIRRSLPSYKNGMSLILRRSICPNTGKEMALIAPNAVATEKIAGLSFSFLAGSFFQVHPPMIERCISVIKDILLNGSGKHCTHLLDIYCGVGVFGLSLSNHFKRVIGIELDKQAIKMAHFNAKFNNVQHATFIHGDAINLFPNLQNHLNQQTYTNSEPVIESSRTMAILDPPRAGCSKEFLNALLKYGPKIIIYISCYPWTQALDASYIIQSGEYTLTLIQPLDFFPQTAHMENIVVFQKK